MNREPRTKADAFFWIFGVVAIVVGAHAVYTMAENEFWAAACFGLMSGCIYLYLNSAEGAP